MRDLVRWAMRLSMPHKLTTLTSVCLQFPEGVLLVQPTVVGTTLRKRGDDPER